MAALSRASLALWELPWVTSQTVGSSLGSEATGSLFTGETGSDASRAEAGPAAPPSPARPVSAVAASSAAAASSVLAPIAPGGPSVPLNLETLYKMIVDADKANRDLSREIQSVRAHIARESGELVEFQVKLVKPSTQQLHL